MEGNSNENNTPNNSKKARRVNKMSELFKYWQKNILNNKNKNLRFPTKEDFQEYHTRYGDPKSKTTSKLKKAVKKATSTAQTQSSQQSKTKNNLATLGDTREGKGKNKDKDKDIYVLEVYRDEPSKIRIRTYYFKGKPSIGTIRPLIDPDCPFYKAAEVHMLQPAQSDYAVNINDICEVFFYKIDDKDFIKRNNSINNIYQATSFNLEEFLSFKNTFTKDYQAELNNIQLTLNLDVPIEYVLFDWFLSLSLSDRESTYNFTQFESYLQDNIKSYKIPTY